MYWDCIFFFFLGGGMGTRYGGNISAALVLGGVDCKGSHLFSIHPHGSVDELSYTTMGSGSLAAMAIFEVGWHEDMEEEEAKKLVHDAISAGIFNDLGSGSSVDLCVIREDGTEYFRGYSHPNGFRGTDKKTSKEYTYPRGTTRLCLTTSLSLFLFFFFSFLSTLAFGLSSLHVCV